MDDGITPEVRDLRARMRRFIDEEVIAREPDLLARDGSGLAVLEELKASAKAQGLWALGHPTEIGGGGVPFMPFVYLNEVIGRSEFGQAAVGTLSMQDSIMLHLHASEEQRRRWLDPLVAGELYPSVGLTEPEVAGSDPTLMQTTGRLEGGEWVIDGHKWFTTGANRAAFTTVFCKTDPDAPRHLQFSSVIVPTDTPGYEIVRVIPVMGDDDGVHGSHCEVRLNGVRVPESNLLGPRGQGFVIAQQRLGPGRIFHCMRWLGQAERAFDLLCQRANSRFAHGSLLADKGEVQRYVAESAAQIQACRLMTLDAARVMDCGGEARVEISLIKFHGARMLHDVIDRAIQVHGALGLTGDTPLERMYRNARGGRMYDGPDEVHRMVVARRLLRHPESAPWAF